VHMNVWIPGSLGVRVYPHANQWSMRHMLKTKPGAFGWWSVTCTHRFNAEHARHVEEALAHSAHRSLLQPAQCRKAPFLASPGLSSPQGSPHWSQSAVHTSP